MTDQALLKLQTPLKVTSSGARLNNGYYKSNHHLQVFQLMLGTYYICPNLVLSTNIH